jgi:endonuclease YncB( thermonuclease family)
MRSLPALIAAAVLTVLAIAPAAHAGRGPCLAGVPGSPKCQTWEAKIAVVDDGDTVQARVKQGRKLGPRQSVRINGVQAMELHSYSRKRGRRGDCHSIEATRRLEQLVNHKWVRLTAQRASSRTTGEGGRLRLRRSIAVKRGGRWIDVGSVLIAEGHGLPFPNGDEWASNGPYSRLAQDAAARGRGIWNPTACGGARPSQVGVLKLKVKWDAEDNDKHNINGEWVRVTNVSAAPLSLAGWSLRDSHFRGARSGPKKGRGYVFPSSAVVPPLSSVRVHVGRGSNSATELYWGLNESIFENATSDRKSAGDGAYLFDPRGNLRAYSMYPCRGGTCHDPLAGKVSVTARYLGLDHEWVTVRNNSAAPVNLDEYELESSPWFFEFGAHDVLPPGHSVVVWIDRPHEIPLGAAGVRRDFVNPVAGRYPFAEAVAFKSWGHRDALLGDGKDVVTLRNPHGTPVTCDAWGGMRCPKV